MDSENRVNNFLEINSDDIQSLQDSFCRANDIYMMCIGKTLGQITSFTGSKEEEDFVDQHFPPSLRKEIIDSFVDSSAENVIERFGTDKYAIYRGVAIRDQEGKYLGVWLCFGINSESVDETVFIPSDIKQTNLLSFDKAISLIEVLTKYYFTEKLKNMNLAIDLGKVNENDTQREYRLLKNEVTTEILRIMESEDTFSKMSEDILKESVKFIECSDAALVQLSADKETADMICEWCRVEGNELKEDFRSISRKDLPFFTGRPFTISSDASLPEDFEIFFNRFGLTAGIFLPIEIKNDASMYLCFLSKDAGKKWSVDELKFSNDVKRVLHSILNRRITQNSLASSYSAVEAILENTGCGIAVTDTAKGQLLYSNDTFKEMFSDEVDKLAVDELLYDSDVELLARSGYSATNSGKWYDVKFSTIEWVDGRQVRLSSFYDITELKRYQKKVEKLASEDYLTGLPNRQCCEKAIRTEYHLAAKTGSKYAVLMMDLDDFTNINEGLGYENGDKLLKFIAHSINDIPHIKGNCYRVGGDEFIVIIDHENYKDIDLIVRLIATLFDNPWKIEDKEFYCTMSMAIIRLPDEADDPEQIITRLTIALNVAKQNGKNRFEFYNDNMSSIANKRIELEKELRTSVENDCEDFEVYYQPIIRLDGEKDECCGAEALVRWNSKKYGLVGPGEFIELAEYLNLIIPIGEYVLFEACKTCKHWNDFGYPDYKVNVNLSVIQLTMTDVVDLVRTVIRKTGIDPKNLTLEVTESLAISDMNRMIKILDGIRAMGVRVALDDFGTGYSSLNHIHRMPIDTIKIDKSFIQTEEKDGFMEAFVKSVVGLADALDMWVCVEGIETKEQFELVKELSVKLAQGFYFDEPLSKVDFEDKYI